MKKFLFIAAALLCTYASNVIAQAPSPNSVAKLEAAAKKNPNNASALRALGIAYYKSGKFQEARNTLASAQKLAPKDGVTSLYLGLSAEETGDFKAAREAYSSYLTHGRTKRVRNQLKARLTALTRKEMKAYAKQAVAQEASFGNQPGQPTTIAVLPLKYNGKDASLAPLSRGIADLLITDLSRSKKLTVLERDRVQALVNEIALSQSGNIDEATAVRTGKLMRAGRVLQGSINDLPEQSIEIGTSLVDIASSEVKSAGESSDKLDRIFTMEKQIVFRVFDAMNIQLTPAERKLVESRPTKSLAAFLAYSSGLLEEDRGNLDAAQRYYDNAAKLDPSFSTAIQHGQQVQQVVTATAVTTQTVETSLQGTTEGKVATAAGQGTVTTVETPTTSTTLTDATTAINPSPASDLTNTTTTSTSPATAPPAKDPASSATGTENPTVNGKIVVIIKQPGT